MMLQKNSVPFSLIFSVIFLGLSTYSQAQIVFEATRRAEWTQRVPLSPQDPCLRVPGSVEGRGVAIGPDQDPVAVGEVAGLSTVVVIKYDHTSGERLWCKSFPVRAAAAKGTTFLVPLAEVGGVAIDSNGMIFIAGNGGTAPIPPPPQPTPGPPPPLPSSRYFVTRCSSAGACASTVTLIDPPEGSPHDDTIGGIAVGPDGNPVLTGVAAFPSALQPSTFMLLTVKVDGSRFRLLGQVLAPSTAPSMTSREGVAVDSRNEIFVTSTETSTSKYDSLLSPTPLWTNPLAGARIATRYRADGGGEYESGGWNDDEHAAAGYDERGAGSHERDGSAGSHERDVSQADEVAVVRTVANPVNATQDFEVTKLDGETGDVLWTTAYDSGFEDIPRDIALDRHGDILVAGNRTGQSGQPVSPFQDGQLLSIDRSGKLNWVVVSPTRRARGDISSRSFFAVAVGSDSAPVVNGYSEFPAAGPMRVMRSIKYFFHPSEPPRERSARGERDDQRLDDEKLAWDEKTGQTVNGFLVCIDAQTGTECQDVGLPNGQILPSTTAGSVTYEIATSALRSLTEGTHTITVIAYAASGPSPASSPLIVEVEIGPSSEAPRHDGDDRPQRVDERFRSERESHR
jgi:outer membrane protein assembly factor BamB